MGGEEKAHKLRVSLSVGRDDPLHPARGALCLGVLADTRCRVHSTGK